MTVDEARDNLTNLGVQSGHFASPLPDVTSQQVQMPSAEWPSRYRIRELHQTRAFYIRKMSVAPSLVPTQATLRRCNRVRDLVKRTFWEVHKNLSVLRGRSIAQYCLEENVTGYRKYVFEETDERTILIRAPEDLSEKLLYKLCKYMCGLAPREDQVWNTRADTLEYLIDFIWSKIENLNGAAALPDQNLNLILDRLVKYLAQVLKKVEERKPVDLGNVKREDWKEHRRTSMGNSTAVSCYRDVPYMYAILTQSIVHRVLVMAFKQLNCLGEKSVRRYMREECNIRKPMLPFTSEERRMLENMDIFRTEEMPASLLYKLLQRVCRLRDHTEWESSPDTLEHSLLYIKRDHDSVALTDSRSYVDRSYRLYRHLERIVGCVAERSGITRNEVMTNMRDEPMRSHECSQESLDELPFTTSPSLQSSLRPAPSGQSLQESLHSQRASAFTAIRPEDINVLCLFKALCVGGTAARTMARAFTALSGSVDDIDSALKKKVFTADQLSQLHGDVSQLDITLLYKGLRYTCGLSPHSNAVWYTPGDTLEYYLYCVKGMRNELAHGISSITNQELQTKIQLLESLLQNILLKTSFKTQTDMRNEIDIMKGDMLSLLHPPSVPLDKESYYKSVKELREQLVNQMVADANEELLRRYREPSHVNASPVTWCYHETHKDITIGELFTDLEIVDASDCWSERAFSLKDLLCLQRNEEARVFILQGVSGVGKTSLCKYIVHLWSSDRAWANLEAVDLLIYVQCKYVTSTSLSSFLVKTLPNTFRNVDREDVVPLMQDPRVLFLVDGYDEAGKEAKDLLRDILSTFPEGRVIVTSKPQWVPKLRYEIHQATSSHRVFSVTGFMGSQRDRYIRKFFRVVLGAEQEHVCGSFLDYVSELGDQFQALTQLPLTLALLALLWIEDYDNAVKAKTFTQIYWRLTDFMLKRLADKLGVSDQHLCREWMLALGEVAWVNLQRKQHHLSDKDVTRLKRKGHALGVDGSAAISSLLRCDTETSLTDSRDVWTFTHNCQQEFLAAEYIVDDVVTNGRLLSDALGFKGEAGDDQKLRRLIQLIEFVVGLLSHENEMKGRAGEITRILSVQAPWAFAAVRRISRDLLPNDAEIFRHMFAGEELGDFLEEYDPECVQWVLRNTSLGVPSHLRLRNPTSDVSKMGPLLVQLVGRSCRPEVEVSVDHAISVGRAMDFVESLGETPMRIVLLAWNSHSLRELLGKWPWPRPLHLSFPAEVLPLLWWELMACLHGSAIGPVTLAHGSADPACARMMEEGAKALGSACLKDDSLDAGTVRIE